MIGLLQTTIGKGGGEGGFSFFLCLVDVFFLFLEVRILSLCLVECLYHFTITTTGSSSPAESSTPSLPGSQIMSAGEAKKDKGGGGVGRALWERNRDSYGLITGGVCYIIIASWNRLCIVMLRFSEDESSSSIVRSARIAMIAMLTLAVLFIGYYLCRKNQSEMSEKRKRTTLLQWAENPAQNSRRLQHEYTLDAITKPSLVLQTWCATLLLQCWLPVLPRLFLQT